MRAFQNLALGFYAAVGPKGRTDRFYVVAYDDGTFDVLNVNQALRSGLKKVIEAGSVCRTPSGQERSMTMIGSKDFDVIGEHHFGVTRSLPEHVAHMAGVTDRADDPQVKAAIAFFTELSAAASVG